jgi:hypothetical protein
MKLSRVKACGGAAIFLMVGRVPELDVDASTKPVPFTNASLCTGCGAGLLPSSRIVSRGGEVETSTGFPLFPRLALRTSWLSSALSSNGLPSSGIGSSKYVSGYCGLGAGVISSQPSGIAALDANEVCDLVRGLSSGIGET